MENLYNDNDKSSEIINNLEINRAKSIRHLEKLLYENNIENHKHDINEWIVKISNINKDLLETNTDILITKHSDEDKKE